MNEDIFNVNGHTEDPKKIVIRYNDRAQAKFDNTNKVRFEEIIRALSVSTWRCYLSRRTEEEILISVPMTSPAGQADLVLTYNQIKFSYELLVAHGKKTKFKSCISRPESQYCIHFTAKFIFLTPTESFKDFQAISEMEDLNRKAAGLDIPPGMSIEIQQEIWAAFVEAQSQIIGSLNEPFHLEGEPILSEEMRKNGEGVYRYQEVH